MRRRTALVVLALGIVSVTGPARAQEHPIVELQGAWLIDGYTFDPGDRSPRGTIAFDREANVFTGTYVGLKLPADRPELHAWLYDTRSKKALHLGRLDYKPGTIGKDKGAFRVALPAQARGARFEPYEIIAFSAEASGAKPSYPSAAFYLYAPLPGSSVPSVYRGHGQDFSFTSNVEHTCYD